MPGDRSDAPFPGGQGEPFFLVDRLPPAGPFVLDGPEGRHAATVRRLRVGESVVLTDGAGGLAPAVVVAAGRAELTLDVGPSRRADPPAVRVTLVQALPKGERGELAVELATEAGVDHIVPWAAQRCVARWRAPEQIDKGVRRWRGTAREAAKQARRPFVPGVRDLATTAQVADLVAGATTLVLHESSVTPLTAADLPDAGDVVLIVGPEGGLTKEELTVFGSAGAVVVRLGPQVLRTSTAGAVALGALGVLTGRWT
ncbi:16S rRNA (uracil(1498)-N(3))-methyltransferase [Nakamurella sp.]|uniref:16S rRNA (uracil(1498)-N(3))-methyltransferase n=1 Tax=Nakamurella sp. TaxID=1869182 RepID=UPI003782DDEF